MKKRPFKRLGERPIEMRVSFIRFYWTVRTGTKLGGKRPWLTNKR